MRTEGFEFLVDGYVTTLSSLGVPCTKSKMAQMSRNVLRQFRVVAKEVDKLPQPSEEHSLTVQKLGLILQLFSAALEERELINAKSNPDEPPKRTLRDEVDERERAHIEESNKGLTSRVRKRRKLVGESTEFDPESKSRGKVVKQWLPKDVVASIPSEPPYPAFFFKKLNRPCIVRKSILVEGYGKKSKTVYICIFDNGDVSYLSTDMISTAEDKVRADLRELRTRGHTRKTFTVAEIEEGLLKRGFDPTQVHEIAQGQSIVETLQFGISTGSKVFVKSIPPGKKYDNKLGIILGMRLSMTEHPIDVTSFVGEATGQSHNVRIFRVFLEDETIQYVWGQEIQHEIAEGTHEALVLDALYERLEERKKEESDARMEEFAHMIHEYDEDEVEEPDRSEPEVRAPGVDNFKQRVRRLVKDD
jgi:hypothetical protein